MEWEELFKDLKKLAWQVVELVITMLINRPIRQHDLSRLQKTLHDLSVKGEQLNQLADAGKVPTQENKGDA